MKKLIAIWVLLLSTVLFSAEDKKPDAVRLAGDFAKLTTINSQMQEVQKSLKKNIERKKSRSPN